ncbi:toll/interleukin-1 receptor domain-containing protein [Nostoc sp. CHAB 5784]|uniref:toll/interleukin-1 receptor domain-containing protein n=1 Tax=Nostoc mirabile TaxID=2907820 RepID=UPI001E643C9E|nr:toll/interleukin-1 receptor domain-containing protein [Nostoc mirabile]MCC5670462.1 toll/interleukin-1 receptor domain-containing protein [Nostoc mirabile CHAB5784]
MKRVIEQTVSVCQLEILSPSQESEKGKINMDLSEYRKELGSAIISAYPTISGLKIMIRDHFKENPDVVAGGETLDVKVSNWIDWAIAQSLEQELVEAAYQGNSNNKKLKAIAQKLIPNSSSFIQGIVINKKEFINNYSSFEVFFSYSHRDKELRDKLANHLSSLKREHVISTWHDRDINAGSEWAREIDGHLNSAQIILLLISADFIASEYCFDIEMKRAMERHEAGEACVIPIILRPADWAGTPFKKLKVLPEDGKPITTWDNLDAAFLDVTQGIRKVVEKMKNPLN